MGTMYRSEVLAQKTSIYIYNLSFILYGMSTFQGLAALFSDNMRKQTRRMFYYR